MKTVTAHMTIEERKMYYCFVQHRNQAQWRKEPYELTWEDFHTVWNGNWHLRGRSTTDLQLVRRDQSQSWNIHNIELITKYNNSLEIAKQKHIRNRRKLNV